MAKKYKKMNYAKTLSRTGSTFAVAMAVTMALSNQAQAAELPETPEAELPVTPVEEVAATGSSAPAVVDPADVPEVNAEVSQSNAETAEENAATAENNELIDAGNDAAAAENSTVTEGELPAPNLPELPEAPEAPEIPNTGALENEAHNEAVDGYNEAVDGYNTQVDDYNGAVDEYNTQVDDYNADADAYDQQAGEEYQDYLDQKEAYTDAYAQYLADEEARKAAHEAQEAANEAAHNAEQAALVAADQAAKAEALKAHEEAEAAAAAAQAAQELKDAEDSHNAEQAALKEAFDAAEKERVDALNAAELQKATEINAAEKQKVAEDALKQEAALNDYNAEKEAYENAITTEDKVYVDVTAYNADILDANAAITELNTTLENALDSNVADNIDAVGDNNAGVVVDQETQDILNSYDELAAEKQALLDRAAALEADERKDDELGSDTYAAYLADIQQYNTDIETYNSKAAAYNQAVETYNEAVDTYNQNKDDASTSAESSTDTGTADWGNINLESKESTKPGRPNGNNASSEVSFGHVDVKYTAAVAKDKTETTDANGQTSTTYTDASAAYTVVGVYASEDAAKANPNSYAVNYQNDNDSSVGTQSLEKQSYEFKGHNTNLDPEEGRISFYVTLRNNETNQIQGITVNLDDTDVYPAGTYYANAAGDHNQLANFVNSKGDPLPTKVIDGVTYYDISGQSVFVISTLACNGARNNNGEISPDGLDLVLNVNTLIEISKADHASKLGHMTFEYGLTAQAEKRTHEDFPEFSYDPYEPQYYTPVTYNPESYQWIEFDPDSFTPSDYEEKPFVYEDYVPTGYTPNGYVPLDYTGPADPGEKDPPAETQRLEQAESLNKLDKLLHVTWTPAEPDPEPTPDPIEPEPVVMEDEPSVIIADEPVPLAKAPKTGDLSGLWALLSGMSLGGMGLLNRKRKEEE